MTDFNRNTTGMGSTGSTGAMTGTTGTTGTRRWEDYRDTYRTDWENRFGKDRHWSEHEEAYRFGWSAAQNDRWRGGDWSAAESDLERDWPNRSQYFGDDYGAHKGHDVSAHQTMGGKMEHAWSNFKDSVREGWDRARMEFEKRT